MTLFRLAQDGTRLVTTAPRREIKFAVPLADLGKVRAVLSSSCRRVMYEQPTSLVSSIYFDDDALSGYRESLEGTGKRRKMRLRWYDGLEGGRVYLEVKLRDFELITKRRVALSTEAELGRLRFSEILGGLRRVLPDEMRESLVRRSQPTVMTRYRREYYREKDGHARVTVDFDLEWFDQLGRRKPNFRFGVASPRTVVIEAKAAPGELVRLPPMLRRLRLSASRFSKYVKGCQELGLAPDTRSG